MRARLLVLLVLLLWNLSALAQGILLTGRVVDELRPVPYANVSLAGGSNSTATNE